MVSVRRLMVALAYVSSWAAGCGDDGGLDLDLGTVRDAGFFNIPDAKEDAGSNDEDGGVEDNGLVDAGRDGGSDAGRDAGDLGRDAGALDMAQDGGAPDGADPDAGQDMGQGDAAGPDVVSPDVGVDGGADAQADAGGDLGPPGDAGLGPQTNEIVITEILPRVSVRREMIELRNVTANALDLRNFTVEIGSHMVLGAQSIRAASDPTGGAGTAVNIAAGARLFGVPNPANPADIPAGAGFVFGGPGAYGVGALQDQGDRIRIFRGAALSDELDYSVVNTSAGGNVLATELPLVTDVATELHLDGAGGMPAAIRNDAPSAWCVPIFSGDSPGQPNSDCGAVVISEVLYDFDSLGTPADNGSVFIEIAGPAGGDITSTVLTGVQGAATGQGSVYDSVTILGSRLPMDGFYVIADDSAANMTLVANADQISNFDPQNAGTMGSPAGDALQLVRTVTPPVLLDAIGYGVLPPLLVDTLRSLPVQEGTSVADPDPVDVSICWARSDDASDTNNNAADFRFDPSPSPGARNGVSNLTVSAVAPNDAIAGAGAISVFLTGTDFTDATSVSVGGLATTGCVFVAQAQIRCTYSPPAGLPAEVDVVVTTLAPAAASLTLPGAFTRTNTVVACDFCNLQSPPTITSQAGVASAVIYGRIFEAGLTDVTVGGPAPGIVAELGYGPAAADPRTSNTWLWFPAVFNVEVLNDDEYQGTLTVPVAGNYRYTLRYSLDDGLTWTYGDSDGNGTNPGLMFSSANLGVLTVTP